MSWASTARLPRLFTQRFLPTSSLSHLAPFYITAVWQTCLFVNRLSLELLPSQSACPERFSQFKVPWCQFHSWHALLCHSWTSSFPPLPISFCSFSSNLKEPCFSCAGFVVVEQIRQDIPHRSVLSHFLSIQTQAFYHPPVSKVLLICVLCVRVCQWMFICVRVFVRDNQVLIMTLWYHSVAKILLRCD